MRSIRELVAAGGHIIRSITHIAGYTAQALHHAAQGRSQLTNLIFLLNVDGCSEITGSHFFSEYNSLHQGRRDHPGNHVGDGNAEDNCNQRSYRHQIFHRVDFLLHFIFLVMHRNFQKLIGFAPVLDHAVFQLRLLGKATDHQIQLFLVAIESSDDLLDHLQIGLYLEHAEHLFSDFARFGNTLFGTFDLCFILATGNNYLFFAQTGGQKFREHVLRGVEFVGAIQQLLAYLLSPGSFYAMTDSIQVAVELA